MNFILNGLGLGQDQPGLADSDRERRQAIAETRFSCRYSGEIVEV